MELFKDQDELKQLLDKLTLQTMELIEEDVTLKINIEKLMNEGALLMAKTRYAHGPNSVSMSHLPCESEDSRDFNALKTVSSGRDEKNFDALVFELETHEIDKETDHVDPVKWFGILVPQSLRTAKDRFEKSLELIIESANVQQQVKKNCQLLNKLKIIKADFENSEE